MRSLVVNRIKDSFIYSFSCLDRLIFVYRVFLCVMWPLIWPNRLISYQRCSLSTSLLAYTLVCILCNAFRRPISSRRLLTQAQSKKRSHLQYFQICLPLIHLLITVCIRYIGLGNTFTSSRCKRGSGQVNNSILMVCIDVRECNQYLSTTEHILDTQFNILPRRCSLFMYFFFIYNQLRQLAKMSLTVRICSNITGYTVMTTATRYFVVMYCVANEQFQCSGPQDLMYQYDLRQLPLTIKIELDESPYASTW